MQDNAKTTDGLQVELDNLRQQLDMLQQANETLHHQQEILQKLAGVSDLTTALKIIVDYNQQLADLDCGGIYLVKPSGQLELAVHQGLSDEFISHTSRYPADAPQTRIVMSGKPIYSTFSEATPALLPALEHEKLRIVAVIPIFFEQQVIAALNLASHNRADISAATRKFLETEAATLGNVVARLKADADRRESQWQYQMLATNIPGAVFICDIDEYWTMHFINEAIEDIAQYPASDFFHNQVRSFASIIHPEDQQYVAEIVQQAVDQHRPYSLEYRIINATGRVRWVSERGQQVAGRNQLTGAIFDISQRKQAEQKVEEYRSQLETLISQRTAKLMDTNERLKLETLERQSVQDSLRQSQIKFQNFAEQSNDGIVMTDEMGYIIEWNPAQEKITGLRRDEVLGQAVVDVQMRMIPESNNIDAYREIFKTNMQQVLRTGQSSWLGRLMELSIRHTDGLDRVIQQSTFVIQTVRGFMLGSISRDITESKLAEKALRDSELLYHSLVEYLPQSVFRKDRQGRFMFANSSYCTNEGKTLEEIIGKTDFDLHPPDLAQKYWEDDLKMMAAGEVFETTEEHQPLDGPKSYVRVVKTPVYDSAGELVGIQGIFWDITARKQAEDQIYRRNRELALLNKIIATTTNEQNTETILETVCRELGKIYDVFFVHAMLINPAHTTATVTAEYRAGSRDLSILHREFSIKGHPLYQQLFIQKAPVVISNARQDPRLAPDRELLDQYGTQAMLVTPLVTQDDIIGAILLSANNRDNFSSEEVSLVWNVADQVAGALARVQLTEAHHRLAMAVEQSASSIFITDEEGVIIYINSTFEKITGYRPGEAIGQTPALLKSGRQKEDTYRQLWAAISAGTTWQGNLVNKSKSGNLFTVDTTITPVRNEYKQITSFICVQRDITRELALEEQYRQAQKMEAVGQLTAGIAHDFNNILTGINGFAELMEMQLPPDSPFQAYANRIKSAGQRAANLVRQLLVFSRKQTVQPEILALNSIIIDIEKLLTRIIGEHIQMDTHLAPNLGQVHMDPGQFEQIIVNLAVNARDAMPRGGRLIIETANITFDESGAGKYLELPAGEYVQLVVSDTGTGMSQAVQARIFEPFFTTKEAGQGTGLGLATVYGIVKQNKGCISVYSEEGYGTTFRIYLPRVNRAVLAAAPAPQPDFLPRGAETILLVEDNDDVRDLARRFLEQQGYTLLVAHSAESALEMAAKHQGKIHLLFTDIMLPGMNGKELSEQCIRIYPDIKVMYMSGYTSDIIAPQGITSKKIMIIQKPFSTANLLLKIRNLLDE